MGEKLTLRGDRITIGWIDEFVRDGVVVDGMKDC